MNMRVSAAALSAAVCLCIAGVCYPLDLDVKIAFDRGGYQVGGKATALVSVGNNTSQRLEINDAQLAFQYAGNANRFIRALGQNMVVLEDTRWRDEVELEAFDTDSPLGYYDVTLKLDTDRGSAEYDVPGIVLYHQAASIDFFDTDTTIYSPGQAVKARVVVRNTGREVLRDRELRFNTGIPWISAYSEEQREAEEGTQSLSGKELSHGVTPIPELEPGATFDTGWTEVYRFPEQELTLPIIEFVVATINSTNVGWDDIVDLERSKIIYCQPWGYDGPPTYDFRTHLYENLHEADYRRVSYKEIDEYDSERGAGKDVPRRWMGFAPHPDDEMAFAFLIPESIRKGCEFHIVQMTAGDGDPWGQAVEFGHITGPNDWRAFGNLRRQETIHALGHLGVKKDQVTWLGMPDGASGIIYNEHPKSSDPYLTFTTCVDHAPYRWAYKENMPYSREAVVAACKELLLKYQPTDVFCCHPDERHVDHRMSTYFVLDAVKEIREEGGSVPTVHVYVAYEAGDFAAAEFEYEPEEWGISERDAVLAHQADWSYQSQGAVASRGGAPKSPEQILAKRLKWFILRGF